MFVGWLLDNQAAGDSWNHDAQPCRGIVTREGTLSLGGKADRVSHWFSLTIWNFVIISRVSHITPFFELSYTLLTTHALGLYEVTKKLQRYRQ